MAYISERGPEDKVKLNQIHGAYTCACQHNPHVCYSLFAGPATVPDIKVTKRSTTLLNISWNEPMGTFTHYLLELKPTDSSEARNRLINITK